MIDNTYKSAFENNIQFVLGTISATGIECISEIAKELAWLQPYLQPKRTMRHDIIKQTKGAKSLIPRMLFNPLIFGRRFLYMGDYSKMSLYNF
jgi:L-lactate dehydrogenase (cytochrome)